MEDTDIKIDATQHNKNMELFNKEGMGQLAKEYNYGGVHAPQQNKNTSG